MEFGLLGINEFDPTKDGSGSVKRERSDPFDIDSSSTKMGGKRVDEFGMRSEEEEDKPQMLSFSSSDKPELVGFLSAKDLRLASSDRDDYSSFYYHHHHHHQNPSSAPSPYTYSRTSPGFGTGNMNGGMHGSFTGIRGPFTPAQWIELEHQAMIYKYFTANVPVPSNLLIPIRKAIQSVGFPGFSIASYPSHSYGWGSFHLGFSGNGDPEPGRCRRTDGKKWRCSRDAVPDQKYCERHINRGRHRSRKLVEGHTGQAASGAAATTTTTTKVLPPLSTSTSASLVTSGGGAVVPSGIAISQHHLKGSLPAATPNPSTDPITKRLSDQQGRAVMPHPIVNLESSKDTRYSSIPKQQQHTSISFDETSISDFGIVSNDSLLNPTQKSSYLMEFNTQQTEEEDQSSLRHFMENWPPKPQSTRSPVVPWPKDLKSDWTQLSMSIPMTTTTTTTTTTTDFSSSSSSPNQESATVSPLGRVGTDAWGNSMGGPLGEVLNHSSIAFDNNKGESPQLGASPTGVLQKSTFVSVSNSSSVGSPTAGSSKTLEGVTVVVS